MPLLAAWLWTNDIISLCLILPLYCGENNCYLSHQVLSWLNELINAKQNMGWSQGIKTLGAAHSKCRFYHWCYHYHCPSVRWWIVELEWWHWKTRGHILKVEPTGFCWQIGCVEWRERGLTYHCQISDEEIAQLRPPWWQASFVVCLVLEVLGFELRALYLLGRCSTTWATSKF
jgi:hypothetical protein